MIESEDKPKRRGIPVVSGILLFLVLYPLSFGPLFWLERRGVISLETYEQIINTAYFPLVWLEAHSRFASELIKWYAGLFMR